MPDRSLRLARLLAARQKIRIDLPSARQKTGYSCGAAVLRSIGEYYGVGPQSERDWMRLIHTMPEKGSSPDDLVAAAKKVGLRVRWTQGMSIAELQQQLDQERPVICNIQAWGSDQQFDEDKSGHYVVAIGYDNDDIYFMDPSIDGSRGSLSKHEFLDRWHDEEINSKKTQQLGIVVYQSGEGKNPQKLHRAVDIQ